MSKDDKKQERKVIAFLFDKIAEAKDKPLFRTGTGMLEVNFGALIHLLSALSREYQQMSQDKGLDTSARERAALDAQKYLDIMRQLIKVKQEIDAPTAQLDTAARSRERNTAFIAEKLTQIEQIITESALAALKEDPQPQEIMYESPTPQQNTYQLNNMINEAVNKIEVAIRTIRDELQPPRAGTERYKPTPHKL